MDQVRLDWDWGLSTKLVFGDWTLRHLQLDGPSVPSPALSVSWVVILKHPTHASMTSMHGCDLYMV